MITRHQSVMHKAATQFTETRVAFHNSDPLDAGVPWSEMHMEREIWEGMGRPETVTVSVVPGDTLNNTLDEAPKVKP